MKATLKFVTPQLAAKWLKNNIGNNRKISKATVSRYASDMAAGKWLITGEPIQFDTEGRLINGQHRLNAVVESKTAIQMLVIEGILPEAMPVLDTGRVRTAGDALSISGIGENANKIASLARKIIAFQNGSLSRVVGAHRGGLRKGGSSIANHEILDFVKNNNLDVHVSFATRIMYAQVTGAFNHGEYAFFHWLLSQKSEEGADTFLRNVALLENISASSPIRTLVHKINKSSFALDGRQKIHAVLLAWNGWRQGKENINIHVGRIDGDLPEII